MSKILNQLAALNDAINRKQDGTPPVPTRDEPGGAELEALTAELLELKPDAAQHVARVGALLSEVKALLGHGSFVAWLTEVAGMTRSTATKYMRAVELPNLDVLEPLGVEKLYILRALDNVDELTPDSTLPVPPDNAAKSLRDMSTRELRGAVQAQAPERTVRRPMRRDLVQRYVHLRSELAVVVDQLNNGDHTARQRFERITGQPATRAAEILPQLP